MERDYIDDSERNVVFHVVELAGRLFRGRRGGGLRLGSASAFRTRLAGPGTRAEHLHRVGDDLGRVAVLALLVLPLARADAALDVDLRALLQIFARDLRQPAEEG